MAISEEKHIIPDYFVAQFPGGGQRGFATVLMLDWLEKQTGLPTHQLFPYVTTGSVGMLIAAALYLPHPNHPNAARMSARQLLDVFPDIAARTPKKAAAIINRNSREPFADIIRIFIGDAELKDLLGTVFFSSHEIGGVSQSHKTPKKIIHPVSGKAEYSDIYPSNTKIMDIALAGTALPSIFQAYDGHIDLAFSQTYAASLLTIRRLFSAEAQGAFVRVGNFRGQAEKSRQRLYSSGYLTQSMALFDAISDGAYAQTIGFANELFKGLSYNLEIEIPKGYTDPPEIKANYSHPHQFIKIRVLVDKYISDNRKLFENLADSLKVVALERIKNYPETSFGIPPYIQEFPLPDIRVLNSISNDTMSYMFGLAAGKLTKGVVKFVEYTARSAFEYATSPPVMALVKKGNDKLNSGLESWERKLLPSMDRRKISAPINIEENKP